ncbi:hypothetical protein MML48_4g00013108 [Holotrichia oblita]|uniref:Uncharacterized protein n=1 Tax=Holotrichia oblita TaxID=644536 RepID=A0ACB9TA70_HOLOL|nr:hypothetical protein MML48_4g00013108 [Holotrichia oblita]
MPKGLNFQSKKLVASLISYFEKERDNGGPKNVRKRVADALQLHPSTVSAISKDVKEGRSLSSPKKIRNRKKPVTNIDDCDQIAIRNTIYDMYQNSKFHSTSATC